MTCALEHLSSWLGVTLVGVALIGCVATKTTPLETPATQASASASAPVTTNETPAAEVVDGADDAQESNVIVVEPMRIHVVRDDEGNEQVVATDARSLFDEANDLLAEGQYEGALSLYDEIQADFAESALAVPALFNAGLALEGLDRVDDAVQRYLLLAQNNKTSRDSVDARIRASALYAERERWSAALEVLDGLLAIKGLGASDRVEGRARRGYVLLEAKDYSAAESELRKAIERYEELKSAGAALDGDYFRAMAQFYLGDIPRRQFEAIPIRLPESQMQRDMEAKAELVLLAKESFDKTIELGNIYWATAAGFRLADMQRNFWSSIIGAPVPPHLSTQASELYVQEVHRHALSLLKEALHVHGLNVQLATVYKSQTDWSEASARAMATLTELVGREQAGELVTASEIAATGVSANRDSGEYLPGRIEL